MDITATPELAAAPADSGTREVIDVTAAVLAFDDFYRLSSSSITRALTVTLNDAELAADATNEAMTRAFQRWSKISTYDNPSAWVYRVGLNWSSSWRQRRRRERDRPVQLTPATAELDSRDDSLDVALAHLSLEHRAVVVCRIYLDWSVEQTAKALKVAPGTVKSRLARALAQLREVVLAPEEDEGDR